MGRVGILALQGDVREHKYVLLKGAPDLVDQVIEVRYPEQLDYLDALIIPGGESTTFSTLMEYMDLFAPLKERIENGLPVFGTCAGLILLAKNVVDKKEGQLTLGVLDVTVKRNAYGRQVDSFEADISIKGLDKPYRAIFIRAPMIEEVGEGVEVLAEHNGKPILVRQGNILGATFHPELNLALPELGTIYIPDKNNLNRLPYYYVHRYFLEVMAGFKCIEDQCLDEASE